MFPQVNTLSIVQMKILHIISLSSSFDNFTNSCWFCHSPSISLNHKYKIQFEPFYFISSHFRYYFSSLHGFEDFIGFCFVLIILPEEMNPHAKKHSLYYFNLYQRNTFHKCLSLFNLILKKNLKKNIEPLNLWSS